MKADGKKSDGQWNIAIGDCLEKRVDWVYDGTPRYFGIDSLSQNDFIHRYKYWWAKEAQQVMNTYCPLMDSLVRTELGKEASLQK